jgi:predicted Zn-dependent protease
MDSLQRGLPTPLTSYSLACEADDLDPLPWNRRAEFLFRRWRAAGSNGTGLLEDAISAQREAIARDPRNPRLKFELGEWHWMAYHDGGDENSLRDAIDSLKQAVSGYPNSSLFQGTLSVALDAAGDEAARAHANRAIELDDLNRAAGHIDKLLAANLRDELTRISGESSLEAEGD